jgi:hypothetical protein
MRLLLKSAKIYFKILNKVAFTILMIVECDVSQTLPAGILPGKNCLGRHLPGRRLPADTFVLLTFIRRTNISRENVPGDKCFPRKYIYEQVPFGKIPLRTNFFRANVVEHGTIGNME